MNENMLVESNADYVYLDVTMYGTVLYFIRYKLLSTVHYFVDCELTPVHFSTSISSTNRTVASQ